jgi:hypothetical protein
LTYPSARIIYISTRFIYLSVRRDRQVDDAQCGQEHLPGRLTHPPN